MTENEYIDLSQKIYDLIIKEIDFAKNENYLSSEHKERLKTMYEFFRLIRGEAFYDFRPPTPNFQNELYKMERDILEKVKNLI